MTTLQKPPLANRGVQIDKVSKNPLTAMIDYLRVSFKTHNVDMVLTDILHLKKEFMQHKDAGFYGYIGTYQLDSIKVFYSQADDNRGTLIELSGAGCRQYETFLRARKIDWFDFFEDCKAHGGKFPRLDIAIDDRKTYFEIPSLLEKLRDGEAISKFKKIEYNGSMTIETSVMGGTTIYFGSKKHSEVYFCFYEKNYEQAEKYNQDVDEVGNWNRYELRFKNDRANVVISELIKYKRMLPVAKGVLKYYLRFVEKGTSEYRETWKTSHFWEVFLNDVEKLKIFRKPQDDFYLKSRNWYLNQASATRKMIKMAEDTLGSNELEKFEDDVELNDKQMHMLKVYLTSVEEMVV